MFERKEKKMDWIQPIGANYRVVRWIIRDIVYSNSAFPKSGSKYVTRNVYVEYKVDIRSKDSADNESWDNFMIIREPANGNIEVECNDLKKWDEFTLYLIKHCSGER